MATITGYIGQTPSSSNGHVWSANSNESGWWQRDFWPNIRTKYAEVSGTAIIRALNANEALTKVSFSYSSNPHSGWYHSADQYSGGTDTCSVYIQDTSGQNSKLLFSLSCHADTDRFLDGYTGPYSISGGTVYAGKTLRLYVTGDRAFWIEYGMQITLTTVEHPTVSAGTIITRAQMESLRTYKNALGVFPTAVTQGGVIYASDGNTYRSGLTAGTTIIDDAWYNGA